MPDFELRETFVGVELELPNGSQLRGRVIPWREGMRVKSLLGEYLMLPTQENMDTLWSAFSALTGITESVVQARCPDISLGELLDMMNRFTLLRRDGPTAAGTATGPTITAGPPNSDLSPPNAVAAPSPVAVS